MATEYYSERDLMSLALNMTKGKGRAVDSGKTKGIGSSLKSLEEMQSG